MEWKFSDPVNVTTITLRQIVKEGKPILYVAHDLDDGMWQFLDGEVPKVEDGIVVCLEEIVELDSSVEELADLPLGWRAWRDSLEDKWKRERMK